MARQKPIYDKSISVEKFDVPQSVGFAEEVVLKKEVVLSARDVIDMLAGYQIESNSIIKTSPENNVTPCLLCGEMTNAPERKICFKCHKKYMKNIYNQLISENVFPESINFKFRG